MIYLNLDDKLLKETSELDEENFKEYINKIVNTALERNNIFNKNIYVSISYATRDEIKKLNKEYRNIDRETDVLSFPIFTKEELLDLKFDQIELGDIIICLDVVRQQAIEYKTGIKRELLYMITHGICHLLGYDHEIDEEKTIMRREEEEILEVIGVSR